MALRIAIDNQLRRNEAQATFRLKKGRANECDRDQQVDQILWGIARDS